jgi:hypothetical protein
MLENTVRISKVELFPTTLLRVDVQSFFSEEDIILMKSEIESIIEEKTNMQINDETPNWQSLPILFNEKKVKNIEVWNKLRYTFHQSVMTYLSNAEEFIKNQNSINIISSRAWFYRSSTKSLNHQASPNNPTHNHNPSFLSGVFYLDVPEDCNGGGTIFCDTRQLPSLREFHLNPVNLSWVIFPGWMNHRTGEFDTEGVRYVIAADSYVEIIS